MITTRNHSPFRCLFLCFCAVSLVLSLAILCACQRSSSPGEKEEVPTLPSEVPEKIRAAAGEICDRLGGAMVLEWFWDIEDQCWECRLHGLPRSAELDITTDAEFSELELVYDLAEVEDALPDVAKRIKEMCRSEHNPTKGNPFIELSLRRREYLDKIPALQQAWSLDGVVMEFQCPTGADFELDAKGMFVTRKVDDQD